MSYLKRKWERGFSLIETLVVVAIIAGAVGVIVTVAINVQRGIERQDITRTLSTTSVEIRNWLNKSYRAQCDGTARPYELAPTAATVTAVTERGGTPAPAQYLLSSTAAPQAPCRRMWRGMLGWLKRSESDNTWRLGTDDGPRVGVSIARAATMTAAQAATFLGGAAAATNPVAAVPCAGTPRLILGVPMSDLEVCEGVITFAENLAPVTAVSCHEFAAANAATPDMDAAALICFG